MSEKEEVKVEEEKVEEEEKRVDEEEKVEAGKEEREEVAATNKNMLEEVSFNQTTKELREEIADVKKTLNVIIVSLQTANDKITRISEAIATSASNIGDSNIKDSNNNKNNVKRGNNYSSSKSSRKSSFSSDESSGESDGNSNANCSGISRKRRRKRRQKSGENDLRGKNVFDSNPKNFISQNSGDSNNTDNSNNQTNTNFCNSNEKIKDLEKQCAVLQLQIQSWDKHLHAVDLQSTETSYELQLQERKKNNLILFGLHENEQDDIHHLKTLFSNLGADIDVNNTQIYRTGSSLEKCRPLIVKLRNQEEKAEILFKAKSLKNNQNFQGVSITHDLTKRQCQAEKVREMDLRREAEEKNCHLSENEKSDKVWKVVGGRGTRRVVLRDRVMQ